MNIPKPRAAEYLGIKERQLASLIKQGHLKNHDLYHITLDSLVNYKASKLAPVIKQSKRSIITMSAKSLRKEDNKLIIEFTSDTALYNFIDRLYKLVDVRIKGVQS